MRWLRRSGVLTVVMLGGLTNVTPGSIEAAGPPVAAAAACKGDRVVIGAALTCLRTGVSCKPRRKAAYARAGWVCSKRRTLKPGSLKLRRGGAAIAVERSGKVGFPAALQAFDQVVADLPGVKRVRGAIGTIDSTTGPRLWLERYRSRLTKAQRRVLDRALRRPRTGAVARGGVSPHLGANHDATHKLAKVHEVFNETMPRVEARVGRPLGVAVDLHLSPGHPTDKNALTGTFMSYAGSAAPCVIEVYPSWLAAGPDTQRPAMAHEIGHCYQGRMGTEEEVDNTPAWLLEGGITWLASSIAAQWMGKAYVSNHYPSYIKSIGKPVTQLSYDALGVFQELSEAGAPAEQLIFSLVLEQDPYAALVEAGGAPFVTDWAPGYLRAPAFGPVWHNVGPGLLSKKGAPRKESELAVGDELHLPVAARTNALHVVDLEAPVVVVSGAAPGRMRGAGGPDRPIEPGQYCIQASATCKCPEISGTLILAVSGVNGTDGDVSLTGRPESECDDPPQPPGPSPDPGAGTELRITGDDNRTVTGDPQCTRRPLGPSKGSPGYDGSYLIGFYVGPDVGVGQLSFTLDGRTFEPKATRTYTFYGQPDLAPAEVRDRGGYDFRRSPGTSAYDTEWVGDGVAAGTLTLDPVTRRGNVDVRMHSDKAGPQPGDRQVRVTGTFRCAPA